LSETKSMRKCFKT